MNYLHRPEVAIFAGHDDGEVTELLKSAHYASRAIGPTIPRTVATRTRIDDVIV